MWILDGYELSETIDYFDIKALTTLMENARIYQVSVWLNLIRVRFNMFDSDNSINELYKLQCCLLEKYQKINTFILFKNEILPKS